MSKFLSVVGLLVFIFLLACDRISVPVDSDSSKFQGNTELSVLSLPSNASIDVATLSLYVLEVSGQTVNIHRVLEEWSESQVTWNNRWTDTAWTNAGGDFDPTVVNSFSVNSTGWISVEITALVQDWFTGTYANHGILLEQGGTSPRSIFASSEFSDPTLRPKLTIGYSVNGSSYTEIIQRGDPEDVIDAYIMEQQPDYNQGSSTELDVGVKNGWEKRSLIKFEISITPPPPSGCTLTPGYWKTHSQYGPAPYDDTWALLSNGANTSFFLSGQSYYQVLWTEPSGGNAYYILAHAYIAAELNFLRGTSIPTDVQAAWDAATGLFNQYTPAEVAAWKGKQGDRQSFVMFAGILDDYNNGVIGPGHCGGY